jgi:hypothetical protein
MGLECSECEHDLRGGHDPSCSRYVPEATVGCTCSFRLQGIDDSQHQNDCAVTLWHRARFVARLRAARARAIRDGSLPYDCDRLDYVTKHSE